MQQKKIDWESYPQCRHVIHFGDAYSSTWEEVDDVLKILPPLGKHQEGFFMIGETRVPQVFIDHNIRDFIFAKLLNDQTGIDTVRTHLINLAVTQGNMACQQASDVFALYEQNIDVSILKTKRPTNLSVADTRRSKYSHLAIQEIKPLDSGDNNRGTTTR